MIPQPAARWRASAPETVEPAGRRGRWAHRAAVTEYAIHRRHLRRLWGIPGTLLGVAHWPLSAITRCHGRWNYWWQAHLLDCLVDAQLRAPTTVRESVIGRLVRGIHHRNAGRWVNDYYDDMAWLGLALLRAHRYTDVRRPEAIRAIAARLRDGWSDHAGGGIWWRRGDDFKNVPANGPAAILFARLSQDTWCDSGDLAHGDDLRRARSIVGWIEDRLLDGDTGLVWDGLHVGTDGLAVVERTHYTYCQGVYLAACVELGGLDGLGRGPVWWRRAARVIGAVATHLTSRGDAAGVLRGQGGGDGGLFAGILARYLALAAITLPAIDQVCAAAARQAADLVYRSARAAWRNRATTLGGPLFGPEWLVPTVVPRRPAAAEANLSVQLGGWMVLEAAAMLEVSGIAAPRPDGPAPAHQVS